MSYEYRVCWRREKDNRKRTRLYQTEEGAVRFAGFLEDNPDPEWGLEKWAADHINSLGDPTEVAVERRSVGEWE